MHSQWTVSRDYERKCLSSADSCWPNAHSNLEDFLNIDTGCCFKTQPGANEVPK